MDIKLGSLVLILWIANHQLFSQQVGEYLLVEEHPSFQIQNCNEKGECRNKQATLTLDADLRPLRFVDGPYSCNLGRGWNTSICSDEERCADDCALGGVKYHSVHGVTTHDHSVRLNLFTHGKFTASRVYVMEGQNHYKLFYLKNKELSFDVDASKLPCGVNAALYLTSMPADGGLSKGNRAGAKYGTGYCDAQCPTTMRFVNGKANIVMPSEGWNDTSTSLGACCAEMDLWEGNTLAQAYAAHPCVLPGAVECRREVCEAKVGLCDRSGCELASQRGGEDYYGPNKTIDTNHKFTVVTQFITDDGTSKGHLTEIRQYYMQKGGIIPPRSVRFPGIGSFDSMTEDYCSILADSFPSLPSHEFQDKGGLESMGRSMGRGMVLVMSLWTDDVTNTLGSISKVPATRKSSLNEFNQRLCSWDSRARTFIQKHHRGAMVKFSNLKIGPIGSTHNISRIETRPGTNQHSII